MGTRRSIHSYFCGVGVVYGCTMPTEKQRSKFVDRREVCTAGDFTGLSPEKTIRLIEAILDGRVQLYGYAGVA